MLSSERVNFTWHFKVLRKPQIINVKFSTVLIKSLKTTKSAEYQKEDIHFSCNSICKMLSQVKYQNCVAIFFSYLQIYIYCAYRMNAKYFLDFFISELVFSFCYIPAFESFGVPFYILCVLWPYFLQVRAKRVVIKTVGQKVLFLLQYL